MKKIFAVLCVCTFALMAFDAAAQVKYRKGDMLLNFGIGAGYYYAGGVPIIASFEYAINDAISIGPYLGFTSYDRRYAGYRYNYTFFDLGGRGSYHFSKHLRLNTNQLDLYAGVMVGFVASSYDNNNVPYDDPYEPTVRGGIFAGARWYFTDRFAVNGEVGVEGISPLLAGISFKL